MTWMITNRDPALNRDLEILLTERKQHIELLHEAIKEQDLNRVRSVTIRLNDIYKEIGTICANELVWQEELNLED